MPIARIRQPKRVTSNQASSNKSTILSIPSSQTCIAVVIIIPLVFIFFLSGMLVGSTFVRKLSNDGKDIVFPNGLPGIKNNLEKWDNRDVKDQHISTDTSEVKDAKDVKYLRSAEEIPEPSNTDLVIVSPQVAAILQAEKDSFQLIIPSGLENSLHVTALSFMTAPNGLDSQTIFISAWIYMSELDKSSMSYNDMRTIVTNKKSGCGTSEEQYGLSLYVNGWQTSDMKLYLEYGGKNSGCYKIDSGLTVLQQSKWYQVALSFTSDFARIFIDGRVVGQSAENTELHSIQTRNPLIIGRYESGEYSFQGNISNVLVVSDPPDDEIELFRMVQESTQITMTNYNEFSKFSSNYHLQAFFPLSDAISEEPDSIAVDYSTLDHHGQYHFPNHVNGVNINGVKITLIDGLSTSPHKSIDIEKSKQLGLERKEIIKNSMKTVWELYKKHSYGCDELKPRSLQCNNNWGSMGVTLVDSLDTLWLMGLKDEFNDATKWVKQSLSFKHANSVSVFETTIRELGGLLAAYDLSHEEVFLDKAKELGDLLFPAFDTSTGIPYSQVDFQTHRGLSSWTGSSAILSELGSLQLEFRYLALQSKLNHYEVKSMKPLQQMYRKQAEVRSGLYPIKVNIHDLGFTDNMITFGALGDSFYEYLLKVWLQGDKKETWLREMYDNAINGVIDILLQASDPSGYAFLSDWNGYSNIRKMDHLVCFMPGIMALGSVNDPLGKDSPRAKRDLEIAKALMYTCYKMYNEMETGISAEYVEFPNGRGKDFAVPDHVKFYILRPETVESLFVLHQLTGDPIYREWSWEIWLAINKYCKLDNGAYASLRDVHDARSINGIGTDDRMESFFLAETMKYLFLAQDDSVPIDLSVHVFNTEAHPTSIFKGHHDPIPSS